MIDRNQLTLDGFEPEPVTTGWLYVGINDYGVIKVGIAGTTKHKRQRFRDHAKQGMREVFAARIPNAAQEEAAIKRMLSEYCIAGTEWFQLSDTYIARVLVERLEALGGDTLILKVRIAQHFGYQAG